MQSKATTVAAYLKELPADRRVAMEKLRSTLKANLPKGFAEAMSYGMIGYVVPHSLYPAGYHCDPKLPLPFINIASQKNFIALYHMGLYADEKLLAWFTAEYAKQVPGKLDMGKSCVRFNPDYAAGFVARVRYLSDESAKAARVSLRRDSPSYSDERKPSETVAAAAISGRSRNPAAYSGFKKPDQIPFELIGELARRMSVAQWVEHYDSAIKR